MIILALETTSSLGQIALYKKNVLISSQQWTKSFKKDSSIKLDSETGPHSNIRPGAHSEILTSMFLEILSEANIKISDINYCALSIGPGSFTGIRVGLNFIKTLSYANQIPIITINSLDIIANTLHLHQKPKNNLPLIVILNASKDLVFFKQYNFLNDSTVLTSLQLDKSPQLTSISQLKKHLSGPHNAIGPALDIYSHYFAKNFSKEIIPLSKNSNLSKPTLCQSIIEICHHNLDKKSHQTIEWNSLAPLYITASAAEELRNKR